MHTRYEKRRWKHLLFLCMRREERKAFCWKTGGNDRIWKKFILNRKKTTVFRKLYASKNTVYIVFDKIMSSYFLMNFLRGHFLLMFSPCQTKREGELGACEIKMHKNKYRNVTRIVKSYKSHFVRNITGQISICC